MRFIIASFVTAEEQKLKWPSKDDWLNKLQYDHISGYLSTHSPSWMANLCGLWKRASLPSRFCCIWSPGKRLEGGSQSQTIYFLSQSPESIRQPSPPPGSNSPYFRKPRPGALHYSLWFLFPIFPHNSVNSPLIKGSSSDLNLNIPEATCCHAAPYTRQQWEGTSGTWDRSTVAQLHHFPAVWPRAS